MTEGRRRKYLRIFRDELSEHVTAMTASLLTLEERWDDTAMAELLRRLHTVKGSAYMIELPTAGDLAHRLEDRLKPVRDAKGQPSRELIDECFEAFEVMVGAAQEEPSAPPEQPPPVSSSSSPPPSPPPSPSPPRPRRTSDRRAGERPAPTAEGTVRVDIGRLDRLLDLVGELLIFQTRLEHHSRVLQAAARDVRGAAGMPGAVDGFAEDLVELGYLVEDIRHRTMEVRMLPVATILDDFFRTVRSLSRELRKEVRLEVTGKDVEVDKRLLEMTRPLLVHLIRNAIDHGIEEPQARLAGGKAEEGLITVDVASDGRMVTFTVSDDGRGIDPERIRRRAVETGLVAPEAAAELDRASLLGFIFESGFSTARSVTEVSGRGVGMDVVKRGIEEMKGTLDVDSRPGEGTRITFTLPMTLSVIAALVVKEAGHTYAVPLPAVVETVRLRSGDVVDRGRGEGVLLHGEVLPLVRLADLLGLPVPEEASGDRIPAVVLRRRGERLAMAVDCIVGDQEIVVKSLGSHLKTVRYVLGATVGGSGVPALILNAHELFESDALSRPAKRFTAAGRPRRARILVIDDSFTTRTMERNILESAGYLVEAAASGEDAMAKVAADEAFDLFLCDIEMPGIDGAEVTRRLRASSAHGKKPVVIVSSSRSTESWRACQDAGASALISKQEFHQGLLIELIEELLTGPPADASENGRP